MVIFDCKAPGSEVHSLHMKWNGMVDIVLFDIAQCVAAAQLFNSQLVLRGLGKVAHAAFFPGFVPGRIEDLISAGGGGLLPPGSDIGFFFGHPDLVILIILENFCAEAVRSGEAP